MKMKFIELCINLFRKKDNVKEDIITSLEADQDNLFEYHNPWLSIRS